MIVEFGHFSFVLAFVLSCVQAFWGLKESAKGFQYQIVMCLSNAQGVLVFLSFLCLMGAYFFSDFSVINVILNSHSAKPVLYKITAVWSNHEGSMVLWCLVLNMLIGAFGIWAVLRKGLEVSKTKR